MAAFRLDGKVAVVTGAASGIGLASCIEYIKAGAEGIVMVDLQESALEKAATSFDENERKKVVLVAADVSTEEGTQKYVDAAIEKFGRLDVSVQNAGISQASQSITEMSLESFNKVMSINSTGVFLGVKHSAKAMLASPSKGKGCSIIITSSQLGLDGASKLVAYCSSKFAVRGIMACAAQELSKHGIRVNCICPGRKFELCRHTQLTLQAIATPMADALDPKVVSAVTDQTLMSRLGESSEIASAMLFLASDSSSYMTNASLKVDGGYSKWA